MMFFSTFGLMFIRLKVNKSGKTSVQILEKRNRKNILLHTVGCTDDKQLLEKFQNQAHNWIKSKVGKGELDFEGIESMYDSFLKHIVHIQPIGVKLVLEKIYSDIGFDAINDSLFKQLVIGRVNYPVSKLKLTEYLARYESQHVSEDHIYRHLDKLDKRFKHQVQQISYQHSVKVLGEVPKFVFYDVTTLYFEAEREDNLRISGFSKDGKHQHPQIVLGLLVSKKGYPLGYEIFRGDKYEGHTLLPVLNHFRRIYGLKNIVVVADSGLLTQDNINALKSNGYQFILGARIKTEKESLKNQILSLQLGNNEYKELKKQEDRLIIGYSDARAKKDAINRQKGIIRLEKEIKSGKLKKDSITNRGYKKFLELKDEVRVEINHIKIQEDQKWDGLKGYLTNSELPLQDIVDAYKELWIIEKAFKINKNDIKIRPIYHRLPKRIEAHICICFTAYKLIKELERKLEELELSVSANRLLEIADSVHQIEVYVPTIKATKKSIIYKTDEHDLVKKFLSHNT